MAVITGARSKVKNTTSQLSANILPPLTRPATRGRGGTVRTMRGIRPNPLMGGVSAGLGAGRGILSGIPAIRTPLPGQVGLGNLRGGAAPVLQGTRTGMATMQYKPPPITFQSILNGILGRPNTITNDPNRPSGGMSSIGG